MDLTTGLVEEVRMLMKSKDYSSLDQLEIDHISLGAAVELACYRTHFKAMETQARILDQWAARVPLLKSAVEVMLAPSFPERVDIFSPRTFEFYPINEMDWSGNNHHLFEGRFDSSLRSAGFGKASKGLVGAFREMADNIVQHSSTTTKSPARGLIGYLVSPEQMSFAVGDVGRGVLLSLKENPEWEGLGDSHEALLAIATKRASRRAMGGEGGGFKQLFKSLADINGFITLRSGDGFLTIKQRGEGGRESKGGLASPTSGLQLSVSCALKNPAKEILI